MNLEVKPLSKFGREDNVYSNCRTLVIPESKKPIKDCWNWAKGTQMPT
jgi:hypothetical protein